MQPKQRRRREQYFKFRGTVASLIMMLVRVPLVAREAQSEQYHEVRGTIALLLVMVVGEAQREQYHRVRGTIALLLVRAAAVKGTGGCRVRLRWYAWMRA